MIAGDGARWSLCERRGLTEGGYAQEQPRRLLSAVEGSQLDKATMTRRERHWGLLA